LGRRNLTPLNKQEEKGMKIEGGAFKPVLKLKLVASKARRVGSLRGRRWIERGISKQAEGVSV